ncbi:MAG: hypothetical protein OK456_06360 [Thaumarchaeota archaeon]|nr:hypothetical protein [Nitrososphaerota archaeon]
MSLDPAIFLAALGITTLELVEAAAVALALYGDSKRPAVFFYTAAGVVVVFAPMFVLGALITLLPDMYVKLVGGTLLLYFGQRLVKSARRTVVRSRKGSAASSSEHQEKGMMTTAFSVGAVEAFEAAIVLVALLPNNFQSTVLGLGSGVLVVLVATYLLRNQVRKVKQANMKVVVSALLLSFSVFWFGEAFVELNDLLLIPLFVAFALAVHTFANRPSPEKLEASEPGPSK